MNEKIVRLALVGKDVSKSVSDAIHTFILKEWGYACEYEHFSVEKEDFDSIMTRLLGDFDGFNVTIPYKRDVMGYLDEVTGDAFDCGSVNTVLTETRQGFNTDGAGFLLMLRLAGVEVKGKKVLVLGGGGSGRSSAAALKNAGATVYVYQRRREKLEELCNELEVEYKVIKTDIYEIIFNVRKEKSPCSLCARMRRGALHDACLELGCNKIALGHHYDDVVETFMLNLFFEGRVGCFRPVTYLSRKNITMIRPLIYTQEKIIKAFAQGAELPVV
ncbi:MAG: hypothetical protein J6S04_07270, partial [Clostridia bacterium]|nr:hypothetical protein [Clostridia bacterium]